MTLFIRKNIRKIALLLFLGGLFLLLYPSVADYWNSLHQSRAVSNYGETVAKINNQDYEEMLQAAREYNEKLRKRGIYWELSEEDKNEYNSVLDISGTGIMGYIEINKINCLLPIYHGTDEGVLQIAIGHLEGSSLPVGGKGSHCSLSGHRGLPSARLFTDIDQLVKGDTFVIRVLDEMLTYEVDKISVVEPEDTSNLEIEKNKDLCTLITCTPYGVNTHRLLVRGHRVANAKNVIGVRVTPDANQIRPVMVTPILSAILIVLLLLSWIGQNLYLKRRSRLEKEILQQWMPDISVTLKRESSDPPKGNKDSFRS